MRLHILNLSVLVAVVVAFSGCGNKGGGGEPAPQGPVLPDQISEQEFQGRPGTFSGTWRGDCVIEVGPQRSTSCTLTLRIKQQPGLIDITQEVSAGFGGGQAERSKSREVFTYSRNQIRGREGRSGAIGPRVLTVVTPPEASNNGSAVRTTLRKTGPNTAQLMVDSLLQGNRATVRADLRSVTRQLPRARSTSRN